MDATEEGAATGNQERKTVLSSPFSSWFPGFLRDLFWKNGRRLLTVFFSFLVLSGCQFGYVWKQGWRQLALSREQVALSSEEVTESLTPEEREKVRWVPRILEFAESDLGLTPGDSYATFLDTQGEPVSHIVVAAHPLALIPYRWCFPFVGCVPYKGHFDVEDAQEEATRLRQDGWDVEVFPVAGYSTLGWFRDPVLSAMLDRDLPGLVELLLHETVHRTPYINGNTTVNESLATHVAREGTRLFFERHPEATTAEEMASYEKKIDFSQQDEILVDRLRLDLESLYRTSLSDDVKLVRKAEFFALARAARGHLYGRSLSLSASNANLLASLSYHKLLPALARMQAEVGGHPRDLMAYLKSAVEDSGKLPEVLSNR